MNSSFVSFRAAICSPDLNVCVNIGSILENRVEERTANCNGIRCLNDL